MSFTFELELIFTGKLLLVCVPELYCEYTDHEFMCSVLDYGYSYCLIQVKILLQLQSLTKHLRTNSGNIHQQQYGGWV